MRTARVSSCFVLFSLVALLPVPGSAQFAERNVNMVAGTGWPGGDPFLRQQNEPSIAVSTRNPLHLLAGANDYRSVDIPFNAPPRPDDEETGDAWLGIFKSTDGGSRWWSTLLDGYPQQGGSTSPLHGYQAGADPVVRAGDHGMFYYAGIVLNRGDNPLGGVFVARFIDNDNSEVGDPIAYLDTQLIDKGTSGQFIDKPWIAVAPQGNGGQCTVAGQTFPAQTIDLAYSVFVGNDNNIRTKIMFTRSTDCGATWSTPQKLSESYSINQGVSVAIAPNSGTVYVAWRRFHGSNDPDSIVLAKSTDGGASFGKATVVTNITPFEQGTGSASIRTNAYPAIAVDDAGRLYTAWSQRIVNGDGRILLISSSDGGSTWTAPQQVDAYAGRGHQFMPSMRFAAGKLTLAWYDLREDSTMGVLAPVTYSESRVAVGNLALGQPQVVFWTYLADFSPDATIKLLRRHTLDVRVAQADPGAAPSFSSVRVSRYRFGEFPGSSSHTIQQLQINPPNLPLFGQGTKPFLGDYIDLTAYRNGGNARVRHVVWTDNRDVRPPVGTPPDWTKYTPVHSPALGATSRFDPTQAPPPCDVRFSGSRNQNVYTTRVTDGLFAGSPGNSKPLGTIQRAFAVFVQNTSAAPASYRLTITPAQQSIASFLQFSALAEVDVDVPPHSTATRTVFVAASTPPHTRIDIDVTQIGGSGLTTVVSLNPDPATPDIGNPDIGNPDIGNAEVFNPDIGNPDIGNPDIGNPDIGNPDIGNPDIGNPDIGNTDLSNASVTDNSWPVTNEGNTTGGYTVKLLKSG
ncbi:MAG TPA: sialidase family protein, partial [Thermoanaerobaculia bacterium]|nr:sialidase family protein [Thermoanaerobaculia bacterium]